MLTVYSSQQHVNNATYIRYAESSRVNWITHFAALDPPHAAEWTSLMSPTGVGLIMKSIKADYKFVGCKPLRGVIALAPANQTFCSLSSRLYIPTASPFFTSCAPCLASQTRL